MPRPYQSPEPAFIKQSFDAITPKYDQLNQVLSFGMSENWRKRSAELVLKIPDFSPKSILDLGCGTGKFLECFLKERSWEYAVGLDFSSAMLQKARETIPEKVLWLEEDFSKPPFLDASFDLVISAFTLRSVKAFPEFLDQAYRILKPGGRAAFLELTRPKNPLARALFFPYLRWVLPAIGRIVSGNKEAYRFLSDSVQGFQTAAEILEGMKRAGLRQLETKSFAFGVATLMIGTK